MDPLLASLNGESFRSPRSRNHIKDSVAFGKVLPKGLQNFAASSDADVRVADIARVSKPGEKENKKHCGKGRQHGGARENRSPSEGRNRIGHDGKHGGTAVKLLANACSHRVAQRLGRLQHLVLGDAGNHAAGFLESPGTVRASLNVLFDGVFLRFFQLIKGVINDERFHFIAQAFHGSTSDNFSVPPKKGLSEFIV